MAVINIRHSLLSHDRRISADASLGPDRADITSQRADIVSDVEIPKVGVRANCKHFHRDRSLVWNFHVSRISDGGLQGAYEFPECS